jgi:hypothetical protein
VWEAWSPTSGYGCSWRARNVVQDRENAPQEDSEAVGNNAESTYNKDRDGRHCEDGFDFSSRVSVYIFSGICTRRGSEFHFLGADIIAALKKVIMLFIELRLSI